MCANEISSIELSMKAFHLLAGFKPDQACRVLRKLLDSSVTSERACGIEYFRSVEGKLPGYMVCRSKKEARQLGLSDLDWELAKRFRRAGAELTSSGITIPSYLNLSGIHGPMSLPIIRVELLNMAYSSELILPSLEVVPGDFLNLVGSQNISLPTLVKACGDVTATRASGLHLPVLQIIDGVLALGGTNGACLPRLVSAGWVSALQANHLNLPWLQHIQFDLYAVESLGMNIPELTSVGGVLNVRKSNGFSAHKLTRARIFLKGDHRDLQLPNFRTA